MDRVCIKIVAVGLLFCCCNMIGTGYNNPESPQGYDLNSPTRIKVKESLEEISGIVYSKERNSLLAINDEQGKIFEIPLDNTMKYDSWKFASSGDYEDLAFTGTDWYVLKSNGELYRIVDAFTDSTSHEKFICPNGSGEYEGLIYLPDRGRLVMLCKSCKIDKGETRTSSWGFDPVTKQWDTGSPLVIQTEEIQKKLNLAQFTFKPSAIAQHPITKELYMLSSVNKILLITDLQGKTKNVFKLDPKEFRQPEGITFKENGDMYISNEGTDMNEANILYFPYTGTK